MFTIVTKGFLIGVSQSPIAAQGEPNVLRGLEEYLPVHCDKAFVHPMSAQFLLGQRSNTKKLARLQYFVNYDGNAVEILRASILLHWIRKCLEVTVTTFYHVDRFTVVVFAIAHRQNNLYPIAQISLIIVRYRRLRRPA